MAVRQYTWFQARDLARAGQRIRRAGWRACWLHYVRGLWFLEFVDDPATETGEAGPTSIVEADDWSAAEFFARDWVTAPVDGEDPEDPADPENPGDPTDPPPPANPPVIRSFSASPPSVSAGSLAALAWSIEGATSVAIAPGVGDVTGRSAATVRVTEPTVYILTAWNAAGSATATASVSITGDPRPPQPPLGGPPSQPSPPPLPDDNTPPPPAPPPPPPPGSGGGTDDPDGGSWGDAPPPLPSGGGGGPVIPGGGGGGAGTGGGGGPTPRPPRPQWSPADFDFSAESVCVETGDGQLAVQLTASGIREGDGYQVSLRYGSQTQTGTLLADSDIVTAEFDVPSPAAGSTHTATATIYNVMLQRGWSTGRSASATFTDACNICQLSANSAGGDEGFDQIYPIPNGFIPPGKQLKIQWSFDAYTIKDRLRLYAETAGTEMVDTGCISDGASGEFVVPEGTTGIRVVVTPDCADEGGTAWIFSVLCVLEDIPAP